MSSATALARLSKAALALGIMLMTSCTAPAPSIDQLRLPASDALLATAPTSADLLSNYRKVIASGTMFRPDTLSRESMQRLLGRNADITILKDSMFPVSTNTGKAPIVVGGQVIGEIGFGGMVSEGAVVRAHLVARYNGYTTQQPTKAGSYETVRKIFANEFETWAHLAPPLPPHPNTIPMPKATDPHGNESVILEKDQGGRPSRLTMIFASDGSLSFLWFEIPTKFPD